MTCELRCDHQNHVVLLVETGPRFTKFVKRDGKVIDIHKLPNPEFEKVYAFVYTDYPLENYASKMLGQTSLGIVVAQRARAVLDTILHKEPIMGKIAAPVKTAPAAPVAEPKAEKPSKVAKVAKTPVEATEGAEATEKAPRNRREKIDGDKRIKVLGQNPARQGTMRFAIVDTIFAAKTVQEAVSSTVERKDGTDYKIGLPDIYFALENNLIELY